MRVLVVRLPFFPEDCTQAKKVPEKLPKFIHDHLTLNENISPELDTAGELVAAAGDVEDGQLLVHLHHVHLALMANHTNDTLHRSTRLSAVNDTLAQPAVADIHPARTATTLTNGALV
ncbi:hypothetical protein DL93DRAFT_2173759 [Clavulina sp. PMI_390]|nr:hypothetical protein DL93DRAFT_2173759 [Clavulina sp. PMI_390]